MRTVRLSADGRELRPLVAEVTSTGRRCVLGLAGAPGVGKSMLAEAVARQLGAQAAVVALDGFHLADAQLAELGVLDRKGAPETFDGWGYAALLGRLQERPDHVVYTPTFERELEQPIAGAVAVPPEVELVVTEGNYLLLDEPCWRAARAHLEAVWFLRTDPAVRRARLLRRHVSFGKSATDAVRWVDGVDAPNSDLVEASASRADLVLDLTDWEP